MTSPQWTIEEIIEIIKQGKESGLTYIKLDGLMLKFNMEGHPIEKMGNPLKAKAVVKEEVHEMKAEDLIKPPHALDELSPEEILFYATPYYDEIQAQKEAHKKKLEEEDK